MESLHRRSEPEPGAARTLNMGVDRAGTTGPATAATALAMRQSGGETPALPGQDALRVATASADSHPRDLRAAAGPLSASCSRW